MQSTQRNPKPPKVDDGPSTSGSLADKLRQFADLDPAAQTAYLDALPKDGESVSRGEAIRLGIVRRKITGQVWGRPTAPLNTADLRALELRNEGKSWATIVATLTAEGHRPITGEVWNQSRASHAVKRATTLQLQP